MTTLVFDSQAAIKDMIGAGVAKKEAEAIVRVMNSSQGELATKADLTQAIELLRRDMIIWLGGTVMATTGALFTLLQLYPPGS